MIVVFRWDEKWRKNSTVYEKATGFAPGPFFVALKDYYLIHSVVIPPIREITCHTKDL
jgi:hypothetical protein